MAKSSKNIVPWICHICGGNFDKLDGGICIRCNGVTCQSYLNLFEKNNQQESLLVCDRCLTEEEQKTGIYKKKKTLFKLPKIITEKE
jgi:hypothetical protein